MSIKEFDLALPYPEIFPESWNKELIGRDFMPFRNLEHFKFEVSKLTQKKDENCGMSYARALEMLMQGETDFPETEQSSIRNLVRSNLLKRGLITDEVYEAFRYTTDGTKVDVDVGKYSNGEPDCVISPAREYIDFFYELYISISYPWSIPDSTVRKNVAKLLATVEELERKHINIKITLILPIRNVCSNRPRSHYFGSIPLFSHKEPKSVATMSSVVNDRLLRKFFFAILEEEYKEDLAYGYGYPIDLEKAMNIGYEFDEVEFFEKVMKESGFEDMHMLEG